MASPTHEFLLDYEARYHDHNPTAPPGLLCRSDQGSEALPFRREPGVKFIFLFSWSIRIQTESLASPFSTSKIREEPVHAASFSFRFSLAAALCVAVE